MIRNYLIPLLVMIFCVLLQTTVFSLYLSIWGVIPDLSLIALLYFALTRGSSRTSVLGWITGLIEDCLSLTPPGFNAFIKASIGFLVGLFHKKVSVDSMFFITILTIGATLIKYILSFGLNFIISDSIPIESFFSYRIVVEIFYNIFVAGAINIVVFKIFGRLRGDRDL